MSEQGSWLVAFLAEAEGAITILGPVQKMLS